LFEELKKYGIFGRVRKDMVVISIVKDFDLISLKSARGAKVQIERIFIAEGDIFYLGPLAPVGVPLIVFWLRCYFAWKHR
jgi:hypothetical protein